MKKWMLPMVLMAVFCACERENLVPVEPKKDVEVVLDFKVDGGCSTKAAAVAGDEPSDGLKRLDLYLFESNATTVSDHLVILPQDGVFDPLVFKRESSTSISILALGNLDPDTAEYLSGCTLDELCCISSTRGRIVLSAGNFDFDRIPMVGTQRLSFHKDSHMTLTLYRIMYRIDIGKIAVDFQDSSLKGKKVVVKNIAITNTMNIFAPLRTKTTSYFSVDRYAYFGSIYTLSDAFGGVENGISYSPYEYYSSTPTPPATYSGPGKLDGTTYPEVMNVNYKSPAGELKIDAEGIMAQATSHHYSDEEGVIVSAGDMTQRHEFTVERSFYGLFWNISSARTLVGSTGSQNAAQKLVLEVEIDGETWFYPILLYMIQPNYVYKVGCITLLYRGSKYANFYEERYMVDLRIQAEPWTVVDVNNLSVGADPQTGQPIPDDMQQSYF